MYGPAVCRDLNGDGIPDMTFKAFPPQSWMQWQIWANAGTNEFALAMAETSRTGIGFVAGDFEPRDAGDSDRDQLVEVAGLNYEWVEVSDHTFWNDIVLMESAAPCSLPVRLSWYDRLSYQCVENGLAYMPGDIDGDTWPEIIVTLTNGEEPCGPRIYENRGDNSYALVWRSDEKLPSLTGAVYDFDSDGRIEIVVCSCWPVRTIECTGNNSYWIPPWTDRTPYPNGDDVFAGRDVDQNGKPEFFVRFARYLGMGEWMHYLYGWEATGDNEYQQFFIDSVVSVDPYGSSQCGDVDGDGVDEIVLTAYGKSVVYEGDGPGRFDRVHTWYGLCFVKVTIRDLNRNGYNEVVLASADHVDVYEIEAIRLLTPNAGGLVPGETCRVSWETFDPPRCDSVSLFLRRDSTWLLDTIATGLAPADTPYCWIVPDIRADSCRLVAIAYGPGWQYDESDSVLRIPGGGIGEELPRAAYTFRLSVLPNPASGRTSVRYELTRSGPVTLAAYDQTGRQVAVLASGVHDRGRYRLDWHCTGAGGLRLPAGVYFLRLEAGEGLRSEKVILSAE